MPFALACVLAILPAALHQSAPPSDGALDQFTRKGFDSANATSRPTPALISTDRTYDENGNLTVVAEHKLTAAGAVTETTARTYDKLDRLKTETRYDGKLLTYDYFPHGERKSITDPDNDATAYTYDEQNRLKTATVDGSVSTYTYFADGLQSSLTLGNGVVEQRQYDLGGKLTSISNARAAGTLSRFDYTYDRDGNRIQQVETRTDPATQALKPAETTLYGYDTLDRLTGTAYPDHSVLYRLDPVGNRTGERQTSDVLAALGPSAFATATHLTHDVTAVFDASDWLISRSDALDATKSASFGYDPNGNLTSKTTTATTRTFLWDARNTLTLVRDNGAELGRYDYRWDGLRVKRSAQSQQVEYVLDDKFILSEGDGSTASHGTKRRYHYGTQPLAESEVSGASRFTTWLDTDAQGSVTDASQADGTVRTERQYDGWGNYRNSTAPSATDPKLGYTGHQFDPETRLTYARARYYDSELGIFLSRDPKEPASGDAPWLDRYVYVRGNPLRYIDIEGLREATVEEAAQIAALMKAGAKEQQLQANSTFNQLVRFVENPFSQDVTAPAAAALAHYARDEAAAIARAGEDEAIVAQPSRIPGAGINYVSIESNGIRIPGAASFAESFMGAGVVQETAQDRIRINTRVHFETASEHFAIEQNIDAYNQTIGTEQAAEMLLMVGLGGSAPAVRAENSRSYESARYPEAWQSDAPLFSIQPGLAEPIRGVSTPLVPEPTVLEVSPWKLNRSESLSGRQSSRVVAMYKERMTKGWGDVDPIEAVEHEGQLYVVDGHHRLRAAKDLNLPSVPVQKVEFYTQVGKLADAGRTNAGRGGRGTGYA